MPCLLPLVSSVLLQPSFLTQWQLKSILCFLCWFYILKQGQKPFFLKGHTINISDFVDNVISVTVAQLCFCSMHAAIDMMKQMSVAMIQANETKQKARGPDFGLQPIVYCFKVLKWKATKFCKAIILQFKNK